MPAVISSKRTIRGPGRMREADASRMRSIDIHGLARVTLLAGLAVMCLLSQGCSSGNGLQPPAVLLETPMGVTPLYSPQPAPVMPGGSVGPPPGLEGTPPAPVQMVS